MQKLLTLVFIMQPNMISRKSLLIIIFEWLQTRVFGQKSFLLIPQLLKSGGYGVHDKFK